MTLDEFFKGYEEAWQLFETLHSMVSTIGPVELHATKSQIAFRRRTAFAWVWIPDKYLHGKTAVPENITLSSTMTGIEFSFGSFFVA